MKPPVEHALWLLRHSLQFFLLHVIRSPDWHELTPLRFIFFLYRHSRKYLSSFQQGDEYKARRLGQAMLLLMMRSPEEVEAKAVSFPLITGMRVYRFHRVYCGYPRFTG